MTSILTITQAQNIFKVLENFTDGTNWIDEQWNEIKR